MQYANHAVSAKGPLALPQLVSCVHLKPSILFVTFSPSGTHGWQNSAFVGFVLTG